MESETKQATSNNTEPAIIKRPVDAAAESGTPLAGAMASAIPEWEHTPMKKMANEEEGALINELGQPQEFKQQAESRIRLLVSKSTGFFRNIIPRAKEYFSETERVKRAAGRLGAVAAVGGLGALAFNKTRQQDRRFLRLHR